MDSSPPHWARPLFGEARIKDIYLVGLALDYCVKYSTLDARQLGLKTFVIVDGCRGIELEPGAVGRALNEMKRAGAILLKAMTCSRSRLVRRSLSEGMIPAGAVTDRICNYAIKGWPPAS
jgi:hypothetical protein